MATSILAMEYSNIDSASKNNATDTPQVCAQFHTLLIENAILSRAIARQQERHSQYVKEAKQMMEQMLTRQSQLEKQLREHLHVSQHNSEAQAGHRKGQTGVGVEYKNAKPEQYVETHVGLNGPTYQYVIRLRLALPRLRRSKHLNRTRST